MDVAQTGSGGPEYFPCHYGGSRVTFRGPRRDLDRDYIVMLGGSETYGRFVASPFPALLEARLEVPVVNLACVNSGPDLWLSDPALAQVIGRARMGVLQVLGARNLSNRYYTVHPRRNDRFVAAMPLLRALYREVDFTEIHFTRHLMQVLWARGAERFAPVAAELKAVWLQRMAAVIGVMPGRPVLYWVGDAPPPDHAHDPTRDPALVDRPMLNQLRPLVDTLVEHVATPDGHGLAATLQGPTSAAQHREAADLLAATLSDRLM